MNISSSQCGNGLNMEKPRIRYRPRSLFTWMSLMTSGVKIGLRPRMFLRDGESSTAIGRSLQDELALVRLEVVVVPQLLAADELAEGVGFVQPVDAELAVDQLLVRIVELGLDAVDSERGDL